MRKWFLTFLTAGLVVLLLATQTSAATICWATQNYAVLYETVRCGGCPTGGAGPDAVTDYWYQQYVCSDGSEYWVLTYVENYCTSHPAC